MLASVAAVVRKSISTSHAIVACDVCGRTLLRGEHADGFLHGGNRRTVCELCTVRAMHEGWIRDGLDGDLDRTPDRSGNARSLLGRLRARRVEAGRPAVEPGLAYEPAAGQSPPAEAYVPQGRAVAAEPEVPAPPPDVSPAPASPAPREPRGVRGIPSNAAMKVARALDLFNASEHPRTVAGIARSLGAPLVTARPSATEGSVVTVVVAWDLSWYRYEIDLADEAAGVRVVAQGAELAELDSVDQQPNAGADERGALHPAPALA